MAMSSVLCLRQGCCERLAGTLILIRWEAALGTGSRLCPTFVAGWAAISAHRSTMKKAPASCSGRSCSYNRWVALRLRLRFQRPGRWLRPRPWLAGRRHGRAARRWLDGRLAHRPLPSQQVLDLVTAEGFELEQTFGQDFHVGAPLRE